MFERVMLSYIYMYTMSWTLGGTHQCEHKSNHATLAK